jgi:hypothetical protein
MDGYDLTIWPPGGKEKDGTPRHVGRWTFQNGLIRYQVERVIHGDVLNACAGKTELRHRKGTILRNDINEDIDADTHHDVEAIDEHFSERSFDTVVFDPPWSQKQADEHYDGMHARQSGPARRKLGRLVRPGGTFVELGFNMYAPEDINDLQGWSREEVHIFRRGPGGRPPAYMVVDRYPQMTLGGGA